MIIYRYIPLIRDLIGSLIWQRHIKCHETRWDSYSANLEEHVCASCVFCSNATSSRGWVNLAYLFFKMFPFCGHLHLTYHDRFFAVPIWLFKNHYNTRLSIRCLIYNPDYILSPESCLIRMKQYSFFIPARHEQKIFLNTIKCMQHRFVIKLCCQ